MKEYGKYLEAAQYIKSVINDFKPEIGLILGSGLHGVADKIDTKYVIQYKDIPNFLVSTAPGHEGKLIFGTLGGKNVVCMSGRFHYYEGYSFEQLCIPVYVLKLLEIEILVLTNAAGAINTDFNVGDVMLITDQIKIMGESPLRGNNLSEFGTRFPDSGELYNKELIAIARECGKNSDLNVREGVYFYFEGPQFETPAEVRMARILGGDAAGMSTAPEAIVAAHCGIKTFGMSLLSNMAAGVLDIPLRGEDVNEVGRKVAPLLEEYLIDVVSHF